MRYGDDNDDDDDDSHDNDIVVVQPHLVVASRNDSTMTITPNSPRHCGTVTTTTWEGGRNRPDDATHIVWAVRYVFQVKINVFIVNKIVFRFLRQLRVTSWDDDDDDDDVGGYWKWPKTSSGPSIRYVFFFNHRCILY
jgi:hypothetical protein